MKRIDALRGYGIGKDLLLVGGGHSAGNFEFRNCGDRDVMTCNDSLYIGGEWKRVPDFLIYYDANMLRVLKEIKINPRTRVLGYNNSMWAGIDYDYRNSDFFPVKEYNCIAAKALVIAVTIMKYARVFLVGVDFTTNHGVSHLQGDQVGPGKKYLDQDHLNTHLKNLDRSGEFDALNYDNVYNCNPQSKLKKYAHLMPY